MGWALRERNGIITSGSISLKPRSYEGGGMRFLKFTRSLAEICGTGSNLLVDSIYFEEVRSHKGSAAAHIWGGFYAHLSVFSENHSIPYQGVGVSTIKRHISGRGNASKMDVIASVERLGYSPACDNEADAIALLRYVIDSGLA
jgi:Holliday junction resolvasome RuvABC endonuclease subunit